MRVMGIDPGSNCTGYGIVEETNGDLKVVHWGSVKTRPRQSFPEKLKFIYDELIATSREFNPDEVAVEDMFYATNVKSALKLGQTRGVAILSAVNEGKPVAEYSPLEVKQSVVGYGRAEKEQETVRKALAVGADRGVHVKIEGDVEPLGASKRIK